MSMESLSTPTSFEVGDIVFIAHHRLKMMKEIDHPLRKNVPCIVVESNSKSFEPGARITAINKDLSPISNVYYMRENLIHFKDAPPEYRTRLHEFFDNEQLFELLGREWEVE